MELDGLVLISARDLVHFCDAGENISCYPMLLEMMEMLGKEIHFLPWLKSDLLSPDVQRDCFRIVSWRCGVNKEEFRSFFSTCDLSQTPVAEVLHASKARSLKTEEEIVAIRYGIKVVEERLDEMLEMETWKWEKYGVGQTMWTVIIWPTDFCFAWDVVSDHGIRVQIWRVQIWRVHDVIMQ